MTTKNQRVQKMTSKAKPEKHVSPKIDRFARAEGAEPMIDRAGGKFKAGIIRGVSLCAVGEALGHDYWIDSESLSQIVKFAAAKGKTGLKSRFTHPGMSSDGMGRHLGRLYDVRLEGDKAIGDLHFAKSAHTTPDGDLAEYVMTLTEEDSSAAGLSIVFHHDFEAEDGFENDHQEEYEYVDYGGKTRKGLRFKSPDPKNVNNYPHVRMNELRAADVVDEPAANPSGMFDSESLPRDVDALLSYAAGITEAKPKSSAFGVDGDRASQFLGRWLNSHGLSITKKEAEVAETNLQTDVTPPPTREDFAAELNKFTAKFGAENGVKWFGENKSYAEALELHCDALSAKVTAANERAESAEKRLASLAIGEKDPLATGAGETEGAGKKKKFAEAVTGK